MYACQKRQTIIVLLLGMFAYWGIAPAVAQDPSLVREIQRLRRELADIQRYVYKGGKAVKPVAGAASVGGSETAASAESVSRLQIQVQTLEGHMRQLTGQLEKFTHDINSLGERLNKLVADVDLRLRTIEGQAPGRVQGRAPVQPRGGQIQPGAGVRTTTVITSAPTVATGEVSRDGLLKGQKVFGTISGTDLKAAESGRAVAAAPGGLPPGYAARVQKGPSGPAPAPSAVPAPPKVTAVTPQRPIGAAPVQQKQQMTLPPGTPKEQYDYAFSLLTQRDVVNAEAAFSAFVATHPNHRLAGNALYWLGETHYVRKNYGEAARVFLDSYRRYPKGNKAPDNLFKLGKSLAAVGEKDSACAAFKKLKEAYPTANARILSNSKSEMGKLGCS